MNPIIKEITADQVKKDTPPFKVGDGVRVHTKVREGDKERIQVFGGIVIARKATQSRTANGDVAAGFPLSNVVKACSRRVFCPVDGVWRQCRPTITGPPLA